jgi:hypothetical protein
MLLRRLLLRLLLLLYVVEEENGEEEHDVSGDRGFLRDRCVHCPNDPRAPPMAHCLDPEKTSSY